MSGYKIVLSQIKLPKWELIICIIYMVISSVLGLIFPAYSGKVFDTLFYKDLNYSEIGGFILIGSAYLIFSTLYVMMSNKLGNLMHVQLLKKLTEELLNVEYSFFLTEEDGSILSRFSNDIGMLNDFFSNTIPNSFMSIIALIFSGSMLLIIDCELTLLMIVLVFLITLLLYPIGRIQDSLSEKIQIQKSKYLTQLNNIIKGIKTIKIFHTEKLELKKSSDILNEYSYLQLKQSYLDSILQPLFNVILIVGICGIGMVGYHHYNINILSKSKLVSFILYVAYMIPNISKFLHFFVELSKSKVSLNRILELLLAPKERVDGEVVEIENDIVFKNVSLKLENKKILDNINFKIPQGTTTAIVGPSGSGKTSLLNLLSGFDENYEGKILIGNQELQSIKLTEWRKNIGVVLQDSFLIGESLKEIVKYGGQNVSDKQIKLYLEELEVNARKVFKSNSILSGGQKQKLDILRNFVKQPKIFILDEATANLDSSSELKVLNLIDQMKECTKIIVAHRLSTIKKADNIIFIEDGKITGMGTHNELLNVHQRYKEMYQNQLLGI